MAHSLLNVSTIHPIQVVTTLNGKEFRYTEWAPFYFQTPEWEHVSDTELYDHSAFETINVADDPAYAKQREKLSQMLRAGPPEAGGWGPWHAKP